MASDKPAPPPPSSVQRVQAALAVDGVPNTIIRVPETARTAAGAAEAIGCAVAQIAKSIVFSAGDTAVLVIASGANQVDPGKVEVALGVSIASVDAAWVRRVTGFAIGGVAPVGHLTPPLVLLDADLLALDPIWAAAGAPHAVFRTTAEDLLRITRAQVADIRRASA